jgi:hypothetical protein
VTGFLVGATPSSIAGTFTRDDGDLTSADNGGTIIVATNGKRWKRVITGPVAAEWFSGVDPTGVIDSTVGLKAAFDYCIPRAWPLRLRGGYLVSGPLTGALDIPSGGLHLICDGVVMITVAPAAVAFRELIYCGTVATNNASITGGALYIDCSNKCATGIYVRHYAAARGGSVNFSALTTVINCKANDAGATYENHGIAAVGNYADVNINQPRVEGVSRTNVLAGACSGIAVSGYTGTVTIKQPYVSNILCPVGGTDADGIKCFAKPGASTYRWREGRVVIDAPTFVDCQGRSYKSQSCDDLIVRPKVRRQNVVTIAQGHDFDFQLGGGVVIEPDLEYRLNGGVSPLGSSFTPFSFQQQLEDAPMHSKVLGGTIRTEVQMQRIALQVNQEAAQASVTEIDGLRVIPLGALATSTVNRAILETRADTIQAKSHDTTMIIRNVVGPINAYCVGYTNENGTGVADKMRVVCEGNRNTLGNALLRPWYALSGTVIRSPKSLMLARNTGWRDLYGDLDITVRDMVPGCTLTLDLATCVVTGGPGWTASGYGTFQCLSQWDGTDKTVMATKGSATAANSMYFTISGGTSWGQIK